MIYTVPSVTLSEEEQAAIKTVADVAVKIYDLRDMRFCNNLVFKNMAQKAEAVYIALVELAQQIQDDEVTNYLYILER